jgi:hypothetical protein
MVNGALTANQGLKAKLSAKANLKGRISATPTIKGKLSTGFIEYVPSNYGLITWDGSVLTVS